MTEIDIVPAYPGFAKKISKIEKTGKMDSLANPDLKITKQDVLHHMVDQAGGSFYSLEVAWERKIANFNVLMAIHKGTAYAKNVLGVVVPHSFEGENWLASLYLARAAKGQGIASKLFDTVVGFHDGEPFSLVVAAYNEPAVGFYAHKGMEKVEEVDCAYTINGVAVPQIKMLHPGA